MICIYKMYFENGNNFYIGSTINSKRRCYEHIRKFKINKHSNPHLQAAWNKYGEKSFNFVIIEECEKDKLIEREQFYIDTLNPYYNICRIAYCPMVKKCTEESRKKRSDAAKKLWTAERKLEYSLRLKGKKSKRTTYPKSVIWSEEGRINNAIQKRKSLKICKLTEEKVCIIKELLKDGISPNELGKRFDVHPQTIRNIRNNKTWGDPIK